MDFTKSVLDQIYFLRNRKSMIFLRPLYDEDVKNFLAGYLTAIAQLSDTTLHFKISWWYYKKIGLDVSLHWMDYFPLQYKDMPEDELIGRLLAVTESFFR